MPVFKEVSIVEEGLHVDSYKGRYVSHLLRGRNQNEAGGVTGESTSRMPLGRVPGGCKVWLSFEG